MTTKSEQSKLDRIARLQAQLDAIDLMRKVRDATKRLNDAAKISREAVLAELADLQLELGGGDDGK